MSNITTKTGMEESKSNTFNNQTTSEEHVSNEQTTSEENIEEDISATRIANAWRSHRKTREEKGKILSASSRDQIYKAGSTCLHLSETCPWSQWVDVLDGVKEQLQHEKDEKDKKENKETPEKQSSSQKVGHAMTVVEAIAKGSAKFKDSNDSAKDHLWLILDTEHWLEICDKKHRYGSNLKVYHDRWLKEKNTSQNFFYWLDEGDGKNLDLQPVRSRELLDNQLVKYLTRKERKEYKVTFKDGLLIYAQDGRPVHTNPPDPDPVVPVKSLSIPNEPNSLSPAPSTQGSLNEENEDPASNVPTRRGSLDGGPKREKWIYVTDCDGNFYVGQKIKGYFHHSSFLAGGAICAAGGIKVREGKLLEINPNSGHYKPTQHHFKALIDKLKNEAIDISEAKVIYPNEAHENRLMEKYKYKRLVRLNIAYNEIVHEASDTINQNIDYMGRHVSMFKKGVTEKVNAIKEWLRRIVLDNENDQQNDLER